MSYDELEAIEFRGMLIGAIATALGFFLDVVGGAWPVSVAFFAMFVGTGCWFVVTLISFKLAKIKRPREPRPFLPIRLQSWVNLVVFLVSLTAFGKLVWELLL